MATPSNISPRAVGKWFVRIVGGTIGSLLLLLAILIGLLQTPWGADKARQIAVAQANSILHGELTIERLDGNFFTNLSVYDVGISREDTSIVHLEKVSVSYSLSELLNRTIHLRSIDVSRPDVSLREYSDGSWNVTRLLPETAPDTVTTWAWTLVIDRAELENGRLETHFHAPSRDSLLEARDINFLVEAFRYGSEMPEGQLSRLAAKVTAFDEAATFQVASRALVNAQELRIDSLRIASERSNIYGELQYPWSDERAESQDIHGFVQTDPLAFADLQSFLPYLPGEDSLHLSARVIGTADDIAMKAQGDITNNGNFTLNAAFSPPAHAPVHYQGTAALNDIDPARLMGSATGMTNLSAELTVDLQGPSLQQLSGSTNLRVNQLRWNDQAVRPTELNTRWDDGLVSFNGRTELVRGHLTLEGEATPFADIPTYRLSSQFNRLNLRRLPGMLEETDLTGNLSVSGSHFDARQMSINTELALQSSIYGSYDIQSARLGARINDETLELNTNLALEGGQFGARAQMRPFDNPMTYRLDNGSFRNVNLAVLMDDTTMTSRLNGSFAASGEGTNLNSLIIDGAIQLDGSSYLNRDIERGTLRADLREKQLSFGGSVTTPGGHLAFEGDGRPVADVPSLDRLAVRFNDLDIGYLSQDTTYTSRLNGTLNGRASGMDPATARVNADLRLDTSRVNQQTIHSASAALVLDNRTMTLGLAGDLPEGGWSIEGNIHPFEELPRYAIEHARFTALNVGNWLGQPDLSTSLTGSAQMSGYGFDPATAAIDSRIRLDSSRINQLTLSNGTLEFALQDQQITSNLDLTYPTGNTSASATADLFEEPVGFASSGHIRGLPPFELAGLDTLDGSVSMQFDVNGRGETLSSMTIDGTISSSNSRLEDVTIDSVYASFAYQENGIQTDTLMLQSNVLDLGASGRIALPDTSAESNFRFSGTIHDLLPLGQLTGLDGLQGGGRINGRVVSASQTLRFDIESTVSNLEYSDMHAARVRMRVLGDYQESLSLEMRTSTEAFTAATIVVDRIDANGYYADHSIDFSADWIVDSEREGLFRGQIDLEPGQQQAIIDSLSMRIGEEEWHLLQEATVTYAGHFHISDFLIHADRQQLAVDGIFNPTGAHDLITTIDNIRIDPLTDLFGYEGIGGTLDGSFILTGPAQSPTLTSNLNLNGFSSQGQTVGDAVFDLEYQDFLMQVDTRLTHHTGRNLYVSGSLPLDLSIDGPPPPPDQTLDLTARADSIAIAWVEPFVDPTLAQDINGYLTANLDIGGTYETPNTDGFLRITRGTMRSPEFGTRYTDMHLYVTHEDTTATIRRATLRSGDGRMNIDGVVHLSALTVGTFDLTINSRNFRAANIPSYRLSVNTDMTMRGTTTQPVIGGNVEVTQGTFHVDETIASEEVEAIALSEEDIRQLQARFGIYVTREDVEPYDFYEAMTIEKLDVSISRDVWLRSAGTPEMAIEFTGNLTVAKPEQSDMEAFGTIEVMPARSYIAQFGRRFDITTGTLTFNGPIENPLLNLEAEYNLRSRASTAGQAQISLTLEGPLDDLQFNLGSEEGLTNVEIISYLVLGRPPGQADRASSSGVGSMATTAALSQLTHMMEGLAASELGLDVIEIQHDQNMGATLTAGAYLTSNLFTSVSWPISLTGHQSPGTTTRRVTVEYILSNWLVLQLQRENEALGLELLWEYSY
jgi:translocation and assembly module TamB